ncbi:MAG: YybS family protein [Treponema sp.]|jgi:hypothetical protein|nr:YybS family protein [Treponema sp.]
MDASPKAAWAGTFAWVPAIIGAALGVVLIRIGFLGLLFLLPLGIMAYAYNTGTAWLCAALAALGNGAFSLGVVLTFGYSSSAMGWDSFYFAAMVLIFTWVCAPPLRGPRFLRIPGIYRLCLGAVLGVLALAPMVGRGDNGLYSFLWTQAETMASRYAESSGADVVQRSLLERYLTADTIMEVLGFTALRGGAVASCIFLFFINRQAAMVLSGLIRRRRPGTSLARFHVAPKIIWGLSAALLAVLVSSRLEISPLEIAAWNILVICGILYLAQGGGILLHFLAHPAVPPVLRGFLNLLFVMLILSPGINAVALGVLILLGIAENWVPFRALKINGSSSTPGV